MDTEVMVAIVGIGSALATSIPTYLATHRSGQAKLKEQELRYNQKQKDLYLQSVREHVKDVYLPISSALSRLIMVFEELRDFSYSKKQVPDQVVGKFKDEFKQYQSVIADIRGKGLDAFIFDDLDEQLQHFSQFVQRSIQTQKVERTLSVEFMGFPMRLSTGQVVVNVGKSLLPPITGTLWPWLKGELQFKTEMPAAALWSREFALEFVRYTRSIKRHIREVTLATVT